MIPRRQIVVACLAFVPLLPAQTAYTAQPLAVRRPAPTGAKPFQLLAASESGVQTPNVFNDPRMWGDRFRELTLGAVETGIAVADFNRDGRPDIFAVSKNGPCALYLQTGALTFSDVAAAAGVEANAAGTSKTGATAVDINHDGWPDIYLCRYDAPNLLFVNDGKGGFVERAKDYGLDVKDASVHATFADYDRDGYLDLYLVTNILDFAKSPQGRRDYLFHNPGTGPFVDVTTKAGIWGLTQGHTAIWFDANQDTWPDLYVANDFETPDRFYLNNGDGTFTDVVDERLPHVTYFSMGADSGDINNDGLVDFMVSDMRDRSRAEFMAGMEEIGRGLWEQERVTELIPQYMWNAVYLNTGTDRYAEAAHLLGLQATGWTWAARLGDLDNDGRLDAFFTTGMIRNFIDADLVDRQNVAPSLAARAAVWKNAPARREPTLAYRNRGDLAFADVSAEWGLDHTGVSFGCALADLDADGDLDLVYANYNEPPSIVVNHTTGGHRTVVKLVGQGGNHDAIGAEVTLETAGGKQVRQLYAERGIVASEPPVAHFGLGEHTRITRLTVRWPSGLSQVLTDLPADQLLIVTEPVSGDRTPVLLPPPPGFVSPVRRNPAFVEAAAAHGLQHESTLRSFDEFSRQRLLPRRLHGQAPALAVGDVNGDALGDVFVTGSAGQAGALFLAQAGGKFVRADSQPWASAAAADDVGAAFLDVEGDGDLDLLVAAGGVEKPRGDPLLDDRLYLNDGRGAFTMAPEGALPRDSESTGALAVADFDADGRTDVFIGGRVVPGKYPESPRSFLYRNVGGRLVDVTDELAPGLRDAGMVTAAAWADLDGDQRPDLILALEWAPVALFRNTGNGFENITAKAALAGLTGWWSALAIVDVNGDGRLDIVAGNTGLNTKYRASAEAPALLFAGDFDGGGRTQLVEACYDEGKIYPLRGRSKLGYAFPGLAKKVPTFKAFAQSTLEDLFGAERLAGVRRLAATELASGVFVQQADGTFVFQPLPRAAQIAPINAIVARDLDGDGRIDLAVVGNYFGPEPTTGRFDGGLGLLLKGDGRGGFLALTPVESGILVPGEARAAVPVDLGAGATPGLLVARCEGPMLLFVPQKK